MNTNFIDLISCNEIKNHNAIGLCNHEFCSNPETHYYYLRIGEQTFFLTLCKTHRDMIFNEEWKWNHSQIATK